MLAQQNHRLGGALARPPRRLAVRVRATATLPRQAEPARSGDAAAAPAAAATAPKKGYKDAIMMQAFGWDSCDKGGKWYMMVQEKVPDMQQMGISHVWLPPPSQSVSAQGYMPGQLYNLDAKYGSKEQLVALNRQLLAAGISPVADIVINHRCADEMSDGKWNTFRDDVTHDGKRIDWGKWAICGSDPEYGGTGNPDTGEDYGPAPDLDHANPQLREALTDWLSWLQTDIGFAGWRLDFVKGYGARFVDEYISATVGKDVLCVGEYWVDMAWAGSELEACQNAARQKLCDWIDANNKSCSAFDFPTKGILQEAMRKSQLWRLRDKDGKPPGLLGWWPSKAVTFIDNHDTGSTQQHWPFPAELVGAGYAYIMTHPGMPCVFWDHYFTWGAELHNTIKTLAAIRRRNGIVSDSKVKVLAAEGDLYVAEVGEAVTVKLGARYDMGGLVPKEADGWKVATWGKQFCVWERNHP